MNICRYISAIFWFSDGVIYCVYKLLLWLAGSFALDILALTVPYTG